MRGRNAWLLLVATGFTWVVAQVLLLRDLLLVFHGNELIIGFVLAGWLLAGALGSAGFGRWAGRFGDPRVPFAILQALLAGLLPAALLAGPLLRPLLGLLPGELPGPGASLAIAALVLVPVSAACGGLFTSGCRLLPSPPDAPDAPVGAAYIADAFGAVLGGVAFTFLLLPHLDALRIALLVSALNLALAFSLFRPRAFFPVFLLVLALALSPAVDVLVRLAQKARWGAPTVLFDRDSPYGNVTVLSEAGQRTYTVDGVPVAVTPVPDIAAVEEMAHLPALFHPEPHAVLLLLGGGLGGLLSELLREPVERIDDLELDPLLFRAARAVGDSTVLSELTAPRVSLHIADGRRFVQTTRARYDLVLLGLPAPATLALNRYFTLEFFRRIRRILHPGGILALPCPASTTYMGKDLCDLNATLRATLRAAFPHVRTIPGETALYLASDRADIDTLTAATLAGRLRQRGVSARLLNPAYLAYKLSPRASARFDASLAQAPNAILNTDGLPVALRRAVGHRLALSAPGLRRFLDRLAVPRLSVLLAVFVACGLALGFGLRFARASLRAAVPAALGATGFSGIVLSVVLILTYQTLYGVLYRGIALFTAGFALGLCVGSVAGHHRLRNRGSRFVLTTLEIALLLFATATPVLVRFLQPHAVAGQVFLLVLNAALGFLVGAQFPVAARICIRPSDPLARAAGRLYAADLLGASAGALCAAVLFIPTYGLAGTCLLAAAAKAASLTPLALVRKS